jgi:protein gp37
VSDHSTIEWTDATWNPVTGCNKVSPGCKHCYAETFAERFRGVPGHPYEQGFDLRLWPERLGLPLEWNRRDGSSSARSVSRVPDAYIDSVFDTMRRPLAGFQC